MTTTAEKIAIMQAHEDGAPLEVQNQRYGTVDWLVSSDPSWDWRNYRYRVKQEPKTIAHWINIYPAGHHSGLHRTKEQAALAVGSSRRIACVPITITYTEGEGLE